jgi:hypothetical protein
MLDRHVLAEVLRETPMTIATIVTIVSLGLTVLGWLIKQRRDRKRD